RFRAARCWSGLPTRVASSYASFVSSASNLKQSKLIASAAPPLHSATSGHLAAETRRAVTLAGLTLAVRPSAWQPDMITAVIANRAIEDLSISYPPNTYGYIADR